MWYVRDVLYAVLYVRVSCFVVRGCGVSRRYIDVCYCDMFSVVNVYLDHLKFYVVCINSRRYVCCSECDVVSNECSPWSVCEVVVVPYVVRAVVAVTVMHVLLFVLHVCVVL